MLRSSLVPHLVVGIAFFAVNSSPAGAVTEVEWQALAQKGGAYLVAIVSAQEFKKTSCGPMLNIEKKWLDLKTAEAEVIAAFPENHRGELRGLHDFVSSKRAEFRNLYADPRMATKCSASSDFTWRQIDTAVTEWRAKKAQLVR